MWRPAEASSYGETPSPEKAKTNILSLKRKQQHFRAFFDRKGQIMVLIPGFGFDLSRQNTAGLL